MLLTQENLKKLKKVNVSKNAEKTKERVKQDYNAASKEDKKEIVALSGQAMNTFYRVYKTGIVNARIVLAMAQTLDIQPWYYTGEIDEREPLADGQLQQFLKVHGYNALLKELGEIKPSKRKYNRKPKEEASVSAVTSDESDEISETGETTDTEPETNATNAEKEIRLLFSNTPQMVKAVEELTEQDAIELLHTLFIRAKGGGEAAFIADIVKKCLLK
jgi:hypothetical protein